MTDDSLAQWLTTTLGEKPRNLALFRQALTHPSYGDGHYQRLEFLGDRVLGLVIAQWLYQRHREEAEGKLAQRLNSLVSREVCADVGRSMDIMPWLRLGRQALDDGVFESDNVLGDVVEALIGALYLECGLASAEQFIKRHWADRIGGQLKPPKHPKAELQELAAARNRKPPVYTIVDRSGPDHRPHFIVRVTVNGLGEADGSGPSRQDAETLAAKALLEKLTS